MQTPPPQQSFPPVRPAPPTGQPPILAEQGSSGTRPKGCGCLIFVLMVVAAGIYFGPRLIDALEDVQREIREGITSPGERVPALNAASCRKVNRLLRQRPPGPPVANPRDLSQLITATPPEGFIPEEKLVAQVQVGQWISGMGDPRAWAGAFEDNGYRAGLQHFWSTSDGAEMATAQVLQFRDRRGALDFHSFYVRQVCGRSLDAEPGSVPGSIHLAWDEGEGWSNEVAFVRGPYFFLVALYTDEPIFDDVRLPRMVSQVYDATRKR